MKRTKSSMIAAGVILCLFLGLPLVSSAANAQPLTTVKVNGSKLIGPIDFPDLLMLEAKAKMEGDLFVSGSGSVHGIYCQATFFFELTDVIVGADSLKMTGSIVATNMARHGFYGWILDYSSVEVTANLDGSDMHFLLPDLGLDFVGSGQVVI